MGNTPDVRVRLSAEGEKSIIDAFRRIQQQSEQTGRVGSRGLNALQQSVTNLSRFLPGLTFAAAIAGATVMAKRALETGDQFAKLSQKTGISVEVLSSYAHGADLAGIDTETLAKGLARLSRNMEEAAKGGEKQKLAFQTVGISQKDLQSGSLTLDATLGKIADHLAAMPDGWQKSALAQDLFGRSGAQLIPFFNKGSAGLKEIRAEAEKLGLVWSQESAAAAEQFNDNLKRLQGTVQGFVNRELAALLPMLNDLATALLGVSDKADGASVTLGQGFLLSLFSVGAAVRATGEELVGFGKFFDDFTKKGGFAGIISGAVKFPSFSEKLEEEMKHVEEIIFQTRTRLAGGLAGATPPKLPKPTPPIVDEQARTRALNAAKQLADAELALRRAELDKELALQKSFAQLTAAEQADAFKEGQTATEAYFAGRRSMMEEEATAELAIFDREAEEIRKRIEAVRSRPLAKNEPEAARQAEVVKLQGELTKVETEAGVRAVKLQTDLIALTTEERDAIRKTNTEWLKAEADIQSAQGQRFAAERTELEAQIAGMQRLAGETEASFAERQRILRERGEARIAFEQLETDARRVFADLESQRGQIEALVQRGVISELEGERATADLEKDRLPVLEDIAAKMRAAAITPEQIEAARQFTDQLTQLAASADLSGRRMADLRKAIESSLTSDLADFFSRGIDEAESFGDAMRGLAESVVQSLRRIAAEMLATLIIESLMAGIFRLGGAAAGASVGAAGTGPGVPIAGAKGGLIQGPGTGTSDSIHALVSTGEYIVPAWLVKEPGVLDWLEIRRLGRSYEIARLKSPGHYAGGGLVTADGEAGSGRIAALRGEISLNDEALLARFEASPEWDRLILRTASRNRRNLRGLLR